MTQERQLTIVGAGLAGALLATLLAQRGWDVTEGQVTRGVTGIAAPIFDERETVLASLSLTVGRARMTASETAAMAERVVFCARIVTQAIQGRTP